MCRKIGMTQLFSEGGECIPVTVLEAQPNRVVQKKTPEQDGYDALQLGYGEKRRSARRKAQQGHAQKANVATPALPAREPDHGRGGREVRGRPGDPCDIFAPGQRVDVIGTSKGRGTAGVVKRHQLPARARPTARTRTSATAARSAPARFPGHVIKGLRMPGRMGNERVTTLNLEVVRVDAEKGLLFVRGGVPGHHDALIRVRAVRARALRP